MTGTNAPCVPAVSGTRRPHPRHARGVAVSGPLPGAADGTAMSGSAERQSPSEEAPRVLNLRAGAKYLGITYWSLRDLVLAGHVPAVRLPCPRARAMGA